MKKSHAILIGVVIAVILFFGVTPAGRGVVNRYIFGIQKVDDATRYETIKKVEDTARGMIASYTADKLKYEQYASSTEKTKLEWAEQAKMRANNTASGYNNFILKNSFVWKGNVPPDIKIELPYLK